MSTHTHDDNRLTIGCPACLAVVRTEQEHLRWADAPRRRTHWAYVGSRTKDSGTFTVVLPVPLGASSDDVTMHYQDHSAVIEGTFGFRFDESDPSWWCTGVGAEVPDVTAPAMDHPTLFDGAA